MFKLPSLFNSQPNTKPKRFITLDIGTDYVKCLVMEYDPTSFDSPLKIIGVGKNQLSYLHTRGGAVVDFDGVKTACDGALGQALLMSNTKTKDVIIGLSGETTKGLVTTVRLTRAEPEVPITQEELSGIIKKIQEAAYIEASKEIADMTGNPDLDIDVTNSSTVYFKVDDNYISDPLGATCSKMEVGLFTAFSPSNYLSVLQKLSKSLGLNILTVSSQLYAFSKVVSQSEEDKNVLIIDMGGETTDVGIVFGGGLVATKTLSIGGRHFTKALSEVYGIPITEAEDIKIKYSLSLYSEQDMNRIKEAMREVREFFISGLELALSDFEGIKTFPSKVLITGGAVSLKDIDEGLSSFSWEKEIPFKSPPTFHKIGVNNLLGIKDMTQKVTQFDDVMCASLGKVFSEMVEGES